jgi:adenosylmethionine-8-amino-7-oxononanoate aminotransferase
VLAAMHRQIDRLAYAHTSFFTSDLRTARDKVGVVKLAGRRAGEMFCKLLDGIAGEKAGQGAYIFDAQGKPYLDACGGAAVSCLGHAHPDVLAAMHRS